MSIVQVALDVPLPTLFDYVLADGVAASPGQRVVVPFGRNKLVGVVIECTRTSELAPDRLRAVLQVLDDVPPLPADLLALLRFCSDYYHYPFGATVLSALPVRLRSATPLGQQEVLQYRISDTGRTLDIERLPKRSVVQRRILETLKIGALSSQQLRALSPSASTAIKSLLQEGWVEMTQAAASPTTTATGLEGAHTPTAEQQQAIDAISGSSGFGCFLLHGITGSGKTEVYVHLIHRVLRQGGQVLLLVPEINLTPQLENYFRERFPGVELASLHSGLAEGVRARNWLAAQSGRAHVVLGTRLAVFTPLPKLALIIVDEEHDASFKQQDGLRYSARDVAVFRASQTRIPVVLGSATPSLESYRNALEDRYRLLRLTGRAVAQAQLPGIRSIDISNIPLQHGFSEQLLTALGQCLQRGEQSLIFINRRGYAPVLMCTACGWLSGCPHCAGKLVLHLQDRRLRCHHCGHQQRIPLACPECGDADLHPVGIGTQRVETTLKEHFPGARILRVDRDSTRNRGTWNAMREQIHAAEVDILVGTQMLAKGHDFPNLTLVGVLDADAALYSSDFRASEKLYAQLAQVAGRAGRAGKPGEVLVQTAFPGHPLFRALLAHDFDAWAGIMLGERKAAGFPPFVYQAMLRAEDKKEAAVFDFLNQARELAVKLATSVEIYGVVPAAMPRRASEFRAQLLVQHPSRKVLQQFLRAWKPQLDALSEKKLRWSLDVDPLEF